MKFNSGIGITCVMNIFLVFLTFALWSTTFAVGKSIVLSSTPMFSTAIRMILAGIILLLYLFFTDRKSLKITKKQVFPLIFLSIIAIYITNFFEFWGLQHLISSKAAIIYSLTPFFTALFSYFKFKEKLSLQKWIGMIIGFVAFIPIILTKSQAKQLEGTFLIFSWAEVALLVAVMSASYGWIILRQLTKELKMRAIMANGSSMLLGGIIALINSIFIDSWHTIPVSNMLIFIHGIIILTLISNIICYNLYGYLLKKFSATFMAYAGLTTVPFAIFFGWLIHNEIITVHFVISTCVLALGLWIMETKKNIFNSNVRKS